ncbi:VWA domain-containing protein [Rhodococcus sp. NPDC057014]|uniref:VWA domain-containing protein n=1 Tax=Rhodococcus sp. NPDC057014 TaxID=3346000 RepID=UPI00363CD67C
MSEPEEAPFFLWMLFQQLRRRGFAIGPDEYEAVRLALRAGFGWSSRRELREVCSALWAKSHEERAVVAALFEQHVVADWSLDLAPKGPVEAGASPAEESGVEPDGLPLPSPELEMAATAPATTSMGRLPPLGFSEMPALPYEHVFLPQYPVRFREVAQTWRRLRRPARDGPATELDVDATVARSANLGLMSPPVLRPPRRNRARLLLLVDRQGSMTPFHSYVAEVCNAIRQAGRLGRVGLFYFHDVPLEGADPSILDQLEGQLFPSLDPVLAEIPALTDGTLMSDSELMSPTSADDVVADYGRGAAVVIVSDGGAARGRYDLLRLLDTVAFLKGVQEWSSGVVWLNPLPCEVWKGTTAAQIARHVPTFFMDHVGMHQAVNVLRGHPMRLERPLSFGGPLS